MLPAVELDEDRICLEFLHTRKERSPTTDSICNILVKRKRRIVSWDRGRVKEKRPRSVQEPVNYLVISLCANTGETPITRAAAIC